MTPGAVQGVPISGCYRARVSGQVTSPAGLSRGAGQSEPHGGAVAGRGVPGTVCTPVRRRGGCMVHPGDRGYHGRHEVRALPSVGRVHIRSGRRARARQGQGQERCQKQCQNSARTVPIKSIMTHPTTRPPDHPTTQHPQPSPRNVSRVYGYSVPAMLRLAPGISDLCQSY